MLQKPSLAQLRTSQVRSEAPTCSTLKHASTAPEKSTPHPAAQCPWVAVRFQARGLVLLCPRQWLVLAPSCSAADSMAPSGPTCRMPATPVAWHGMSSEVHTGHMNMQEVCAGSASPCTARMHQRTHALQAWTQRRREARLLWREPGCQGRPRQLQVHVVALAAVGDQAQLARDLLARLHADRLLQHAAQLKPACLSSNGTLD